MGSLSKTRLVLSRPTVSYVRGLVHDATTSVASGKEASVRTNTPAESSQVVRQEEGGFIWEEGVGYHYRSSQGDQKTEKQSQHDRVFITGLGWNCQQNYGPGS